MLRNVLLLYPLTLICLLGLWLGASANDQLRNGPEDADDDDGLQKVLLPHEPATAAAAVAAADDLRKERDKSSAKMQKMLLMQSYREEGESDQNRDENLRLRHEQHHLRHQQRAWEQPLGLERSPFRPVRHHQHKSQWNPKAESEAVRGMKLRKMETARELELEQAQLERASTDSPWEMYLEKQPQKTIPIRDTPTLSPSNGHILVKRKLHHSQWDTDYPSQQRVAPEGGLTSQQWQQKQIAHHRQKLRHLKEILGQRQQQRHLLTGFNEAKSDDNDVSAGKTLEDGNDGHDVENIYSPNYITGKLTQKKEEQLGTPEAALKTRRQQALMQKRERALAQAHMHQVMTDATCRVPQPRCQRVQQDPSKIYTPHCTVLHRCSEDSGCCPSRTQICAAKSTHNVELHFFVKSNKQHRPIIEKRTFVNHTECHCIERSNFKEDAVALASTSIVRATILSCTCPRSFEVILQDNGQCRCDCSSGNYDCDWLKRGNEHFAVDDRKCIKHGGCKPPTCEYGHYMDKHGRCPKQHEQPVYNAMS
ncbi:uncharacterized protein LOC117900798 isoform X2 [Drosophila subobscura]|uniref:uncharacterized protein LOC117900798 isoform X2 n=1 Tax=Drosophila subobscura TaxID=7241 RepID=UPI00155AFC6C|nr:uncharacterized protein LOC117900798 isoform X2 [Drosophila subobscura]